MKNTFLICVLIVSILACKQSSNNKKQSSAETVIDTLQNTNAHLNIYGNYVDDSYKNRNEGYDWVAVSVREAADNNIHVSIRSRADKKKPTCAFDAQAYKVDDTTYQSVYEGKQIIYAFSDKTATIAAANKEDENMLYFFCSGGATFLGTYTKIEEELDVNQVDKTSFIKVLNLQNIGFNVSSIKKDDINTFTVFTFGLEERDFNETFNIDDYQVKDAEVEDLNSDGSPELVVYAERNDASKNRTVYAFSVNNKKSMSMVYFPATADNAKINKGYRGNDTFALVETHLVQQFPIYDESGKPTGATRQVSYKLIDGEASRRFEVDKVSEY